jgi:hypothetical protein
MHGDFGSRSAGSFYNLHSFIKPSLPVFTHLNYWHLFFSSSIYASQLLIAVFCVPQQATLGLTI